MIIGIDLRALLSGNISGVETYVREITRAMTKYGTPHTFVLFINGKKEKTACADEFLKKNVLVARSHIPNRILNVLMVLFRWPKVDKIIEWKTKRKIDALLIPDFRPAPVSANVKKVSTVHDLAFEHYPQFFSAKTRAWYRFINPRRELRESAKIIAVSRATAADLKKSYGIASQSIEIIHEGSPGFARDKNKKIKLTKKYGLPKKYFLFLSTIEPRKNLEKLIKGFNIFRKKHHDAHLVIAGKKNSSVFSDKPLPKGEKIHYLGFIPEEEKYELYANAIAFVYPSFFEGFGLPILEAMKAGIPVITSRTTSMPEVAGDAALLVDPMNCNEIASSLEAMLDKKIQKKLRARMPAQLKKFSWKKAALSTLECLTGE